MHVIVAGCGRVGSQLAEFLSYEGHDVVVIDKDADSFRRLGGTFNGITLEGIAFDEDLLSNAGIERADAFAAVTNFDNTNLMASEVASNIYKVPSVIARLYNPDKELTFFKLGIDYVCSTTLVADCIKERLFHDSEVTIQDESLDVGILIVEFTVPEAAHGKTVESLNYGVSSRVIAFLRNGHELDWSKNIDLHAGDQVVMSIRKEGWKILGEFLGKELTPADQAGFRPLKNADNGNHGMKLIVGGCGRVGAHLGYILSMEGHRVTVIDQDSSSFRRLPENYTGDTLEGTVFDEETLAHAGIEEADAFAAVTNYDNTNLMAVQVAKHIFGVPRVLARLYNPDKEQTYQALGIQYLCGTKQVAQVMLERMLKPLVRSYASCCNNVFNLVEFKCPATWEGKSLRQVKDKHGIKFAYIVRRSTGYLPEGNFLLRKNDELVAMTESKRSQKLERYLKSR